MKALLALWLSAVAPLAFSATTTISMQGLVSAVIYLLVLAAVVWLLLFIVGKVGPPEPFAKIITAIIYVVAALILIAMLLDFAGSPVIRIR